MVIFSDMSVALWLSGVGVVSVNDVDANDLKHISNSKEML